jgi:two-component system LytT family sensor kinase
VVDELTYPALRAVGLAVGVALSVLLGLMQRRVDRGAAAPSGYQLLWVIGLLWTLGSFLRHTLPLAGVAADATSVRLAGTLAWACTILGPVAIGRFLQARLGWSSRPAAVFLMFTGAVSALNLGLLLWAAATHALDVDASWYPEVSLYIALILTAIALILHRLQGPRSTDPVGSKPRRFGRLMLLLAVAQVAAALSSLRYSSLPDGLRTLVSVISEHWTIPWSILIAVSLAQIHHADLVLKRSLWLLASVSAAALLSMLVLRLSGLALVAATLTGAASMLSAPLVIRALDFLVDRIWLKRPDYLLAIRDFEESVRRIYDRQELLDAAAHAVRSTLRLDAQVVPAADSPAATPALASIPIDAAHAGYHLEVSAAHQARTLMQSEFGFLEAIGSQLGRRLDAIHFEKQQRAQQLREERLRRLATEAELKALRTQVDPHFLFNTLNTIADLVSSNPLQAEQMIERLAECFRYALARHSHDFSTLDEELEFARHYLGIEQVRFGERLRVRLSRGDAPGGEALPSLLLQPLLENAIRHGLASIREGGCISVIAKLEGKYLRLQVDDDGAGLRAGFGESHGVGLQNVRDRLQALYGGAASLQIGGRPGERGTSVIILVPRRGN